MPELLTPADADALRGSMSTDIDAGSVRQNRRSRSGLTALVACGALIGSGVSTATAAPVESGASISTPFTARQDALTPMAGNLPGRLIVCDLQAHVPTLAFRRQYVSATANCNLGREPMIMRHTMYMILFAKRPSSTVWQRRGQLVRTGISDSRGQFTAGGHINCRSLRQHEFMVGALDKVSTLDNRSVQISQPTDFSLTSRRAC